jgi:hypothetical protein
VTRLDSGAGKTHHLRTVPFGTNRDHAMTELVVRRLLIDLDHPLNATGVQATRS